MVLILVELISCSCCHRRLRHGYDHRLQFLVVDFDLTTSDQVGRVVEVNMRMESGIILMKSDMHFCAPLEVSRS